MGTSQEPSSTVVEFRLAFLRASFFSNVVMGIFAIIQIRGMSSQSIKASLKDTLPGFVLLVVLLLAFIHHLIRRVDWFVPLRIPTCMISAFIPVNSFAVWVDLVFLIVELCFFTIWFLRQGFAVIDPLSDRTSPFLVLGTYALIFCLVALITLRIVDKIQKARAVNRPSSERIWSRLRGVLCGRHIWNSHYPGENKWIVMCRALLILLFLIILPLYTTFNVIIAPVQKAALVSVRESWSRALPPDFKDVKNARWNVVVTNFPDKPFDSVQTAQQALRAITIVKLINDDITERCSNGTYIRPTPTVPDHISFNCLSATAEEIMQQDRSGITSGIKHFVIIVYANYNDTFNSSVPLMHVRLGLTNDTAAVIKETRPAILGEHQNMVGHGEVFVRRELTTPRLTTLGIFSGWNTYLLTDMDQYFNDPNATTGRYARPGVSSMIMNMENARYGYRVVEDYVEKSVLDGLSTIGGLFALISSITFLLFGRSVLQIMFGSKRLALFGVMHILDKDQIKRSFGTQYVTLQADRNNGFVSLLCDHVVDIELALAEPASQEAQVLLEK